MNEIQAKKSLKQQVLNQKKMRWRRINKRTFPFFFSTFVSCLRRRAADEFMRTCWRIFPRVSIVFQDGHFDDWNHVDRRLSRPSRCCRLNISVTFRINVIAPSRALCFWGSVEPSCGSLFLFFWGAFNRRVTWIFRPFSILTLDQIFGQQVRPGVWYWAGRALPTDGHSISHSVDQDPIGAQRTERPLRRRRENTGANFEMRRRRVSLVISRIKRSICVLPRTFVCNAASLSVDYI